MKQVFKKIIIWLLWIFLTILGFLASLLFIEIGFRQELLIFEGAIGGAIVALPQSILISKFIQKGKLWIFVTFIAWGLISGSKIGAIGWVTPQTDFLLFRLFYGVILGGIHGTWIGFCQWLVLKEKIRSSWKWIFTTGITWSLALSSGWLIAAIFRSKINLYIGELVGLIVTWLIVGLMTGLALIVLLENLNNSKKYKLSSSSS